MEEHQYRSIFDYVESKSYPSNFTKNQKYILRRTSKKYKVEGEQLFYLDTAADGSFFDRLVIKGREEAERVFVECHMNAGGHKARDATITKDTIGLTIIRKLRRR